MSYKFTSVLSFLEMAPATGVAIAQSGPVTLSCWYKIETSITDTEQVMLAAGTPDQPGRRSTNAQIVTAADNPNAAFQAAGGRYRAVSGFSYWGGSSTAPSADVWNHALLTLEDQGSGSDLLVRVNHNGQTSDLTTYVGGGLSVPDICKSIRVANEADQAAGVSGGREFIGFVADIAIWNALPTDQDAMAAALHTGAETGLPANNSGVTTHISDLEPRIYLSMASAPADFAAVPNEGSYTGDTFGRIGGAVNFDADHPDLSGAFPTITVELLGGGGMLEIDVGAMVKVRDWTDAVFLVPGLVDDPIARENDGLSTTCTWDHTIIPDVVIEGLIYDGRTAAGDTRYRARFNPTTVGEWSLTTSGSTEAALNGLTATVVGEATGTGFIERGHFVLNPGDARILYENGDVGNPNVIMMPAPATTFSDAGPPAVNWGGFWNHVGGDPELGSINTAAIDAILDEFVGASSAHGFPGVQFLVHGGWWQDGIISTIFGFPATSERISLECFRVLEVMIRRIHELGGLTIILYQPDETDGNEEGLPGGYNGAEATRLQNYIWARLGPVPGWMISYAYDLHEFDGQPQPPVAPYNIQGEVAAFYANAVARNPYQVLMGARNFNADLQEFIDDTLPTWCLELYKPGAKVSRSDSTHFGHDGIFNYDPNGTPTTKSTFDDDRKRVRPQRVVGKDYFSGDTSLLLPHSYIAGAGVGGAYGDLTDNPTGFNGQPVRQKEYRAFSNDGLTPSNRYDNPTDYPGEKDERLRLLKIFSFFEWGNPNAGFSGRRFDATGIPRLGPPYTDYQITGGTTEIGTTCVELGDGNYVLYVENSSTFQVRLDASGLNMTNPTTSAIAVQVDADGEVLGTFENLGFVDRGVGDLVIPLPATGDWLIHLNDQYLAGLIQPSSVGTALFNFFASVVLRVVAPSVQGDSNVIISLSILRPVAASVQGEAVVNIPVSTSGQIRMDISFVGSGSAAAGISAIRNFTFSATGSGSAAVSLGTVGVISIQIVFVGTANMNVGFAGIPQNMAISVVGVGVSTVDARRIGVFMCDVTDVWNCTLALLGSKAKIEDRSEQSVEAETIRCVWDEVRQSFLAEHSWDGSVKTEVLVEEVGATAPGQWGNVWAMPADTVRPLTVNDTPWEQADDAWEQQVSPQTMRNVIYSPREIELRYVFDLMDEVCLLGAKAREAMAYKLAMKIAKAFGLSPTDRQLLKNDGSESLTDAKAIDSMVGTPKKRPMSGVLEVRGQRFQGRRFRPGR